MSENIPEITYKLRKVCHEVETIQWQVYGEAQEWVEINQVILRNLVKNILTHVGVDATVAYRLDGLSYAFEGVRISIDLDPLDFEDFSLSALNLWLSSAVNRFKVSKDSSYVEEIDLYARYGYLRHRVNDVWPHEQDKPSLADII
jgi:hypothetical protein